MLSVACIREFGLKAYTILNDYKSTVFWMKNYTF